MTAGTGVCRTCGAALEPGDVFCTLCGAPAADHPPGHPGGGHQAPGSACLVCGTISTGDRFCTVCGNEVGAGAIPGAADPFPAQPPPAHQPPSPHQPPPANQPAAPHPGPHPVGQPPAQVAPGTFGLPPDQWETWPGGHPPASPDPDRERERERPWLLIGAVAAVVTVAGVLLALALLDGPDLGPTTSGESASDQTDDDEDGDGDPAGDRQTASTDPDDQQSDPSSDPANTTATTDTTTPSTTSFFASRDEYYGQYVAILWSDFGSVAEAIDPASELNQQLEIHRRTFGSQVQAVDSNQFGSLRNGTVAVVFAGEFANARVAKQWCRDNGFPGTQDCFGAVLSDDYTPDQRGDGIRVYDL